MTRTSSLPLRSVLVPVVLLLMALSMSPAVAQSTADRDVVLAANTEFYRAFRENDMSAMEAVWGQVEPIAPLILA